MRTALLQSLAVILGLFGGNVALGQTFSFDPARLLDGPAPALTDVDLLNKADQSQQRPCGPRLFRMPPRWLDDGIGLDNSDEGFGASDAADSPDDGRFQVTIGADNPYLDFRLHGDFGGVGYQRYATQLVLADDGATSFHFNVQAVTPAGETSEGLTQGKSVVFPTLSCFHDLGDGTGLAGFVGKPARASVESFESLDQNIQYGVAFQQPLLTTAPAASQQVFLFVEALGSYRVGGDLGTLPPGGWDLVPGIHWQSGERCWLSGGLLLPLGPQRPESGLWQITCSWQY